MNTPIYDFAADYIKKDVSRLHMPGHKGKGLLGIEEMDITEIKGADELYEPEGIIAESEKNASRLFGTKKTFYSTEGSSQCIKAMIYTALINSKQNDDRPVILAARNVHKSFIYALAMLDVDAEWLYAGTSNNSIFSCIVSASALDQKLNSMNQKPFAVYVTSPDYLGGITDIKALSSVCKRYNIPLLVDNAHGAYLKFLSISLHPIDLGADMCCDSAHKTLPVLTGGAYLHVSNEAGDKYLGGIKNTLSMFGSTSPSYLILESLDLCNKYIDESYKSELLTCINKVSKLRKKLAAWGLFDFSQEPIKITLDLSSSNYNGFEIAELLRGHKVECEYSDFDNVVLMFSPLNNDLDFERSEAALRNIEINVSEKSQKALTLLPAKSALTIRKAIFSKHQVIPLDSAVGRICGSPTVSCPPAIPISVSGEIITEKTAELFKRYGFETVEVVCD